jgi:hypothetical protein
MAGVDGVVINVADRQRYRLGWPKLNLQSLENFGRRRNAGDLVVNQSVLAKHGRCRRDGWHQWRL